MEFKTLFFVIDSHSGAEFMGVEWFSERWEAEERAKFLWENEADKNGYSVAVEVCDEVPEEVDEDDAYEYANNECLFLHRLQLYEKDWEGDL